MNARHDGGRFLFSLKDKCACPAYKQPSFRWIFRPASGLADGRARFPSRLAGWNISLQTLFCFSGRPFKWGRRLRLSVCCLFEGGITIKNVLTIAGSDCSGGAGIQADLKTFSAHGVYGMSVIVSVVAENTCRVISIEDVAPGIIADQIDAVFEDIPVDGVKIGMLSNKEQMKTVAGKLLQYRPRGVVFDPVMVAKGGCALMQPEALETLKKEMLPRAFLITPNIPEAEALTGRKIETEEEMKRAAVLLSEMGPGNVLIKGGHLLGDAVDILYDGRDFHTFVMERIPTKNTHGTGCTLSSAIAANLANGMGTVEAVKAAKEYVTTAIRHALPIGKGHGPTNHFYTLYQKGGLCHAEL